MGSARWTCSMSAMVSVTKSAIPSASPTSPNGSRKPWPETLEARARARHNPRQRAKGKNMTHTPTVLSGMQPTNTLHLGNYLGALKNWVRMQDQMQCLYCVVDMHAITVESGYGKPQELMHATREVAAAYIAAGIDPSRSPVFNQSQVPEHAELAWIFDCV